MIWIKWWLGFSRDDGDTSSPNPAAASAAAQWGGTCCNQSSFTPPVRKGGGKRALRLLFPQSSVKQAAPQLHTC